MPSLSALDDAMTRAVTPGAERLLAGVALGAAGTHSAGMVRLLHFCFPSWNVASSEKVNMPSKRDSRLNGATASWLLATSSRDVP